MTTDKPGAVAMKWARELELYGPDTHRQHLSELVQAAIDEAVKTVERDLELATLEQRKAVLRADKAQADADLRRRYQEGAQVQNMRLERERDEARAERDRWCQEADARTGTLTNERQRANDMQLLWEECGAALETTMQERDEARAAARELGEALDRLAREVGGCWRMDEPMLRREIGNTNYSVVAQRQEEAVAAITKHAALLAEPEGGG